MRRVEQKLYKRISEEISHNEMMQMREQGMSNKEIASALGISYATVLRYIGKQPEAVDGRQYAVRMSTRKEDKGSAELAIVESDDRVQSLNLVERMSVYRGHAATYTVCSSDSFIVMELDGQQSIRIEKDSLNDIAKEIIAIQNAMAVGQL